MNLGSPTLAPADTPASAVEQRQATPLATATTPAPQQPISSTIPLSIEAQAAIEDLAKRLEVPPGAIQVVSVTADEFPAGDLGCPDPKSPSRALDAIVTGQRVLLAHDGVQYEYHVRAGQIVFCGVE